MLMARIADGQRHRGHREPLSEAGIGFARRARGPACLKYKEARCPKPAASFSEGLDSSTRLTLASREGYALYALSFDYGQRHRIALDAEPSGGPHHRQYNEGCAGRFHPRQCVGRQRVNVRIRDREQQSSR